MSLGYTQSFWNDVVLNKNKTFHSFHFKIERDRNFPLCAHTHTHTTTTHAQPHTHTHSLYSLHPFFPVSDTFTPFLCHLHSLLLSFSLSLSLSLSLSPLVH